VPDARRAFSFFLHGHLPWVLGHGSWPHGEEWLHEAALATYLPLVAAARRLREKGCDGGITLSLSPVLTEQLAHGSFRRGLVEYLETRVRSAAADQRRFGEDGDTRRSELARRWEERTAGMLRLFTEDLGEDIPGAFRDLEASGTLELATCGATHGYLPLLAREESVALQVELARRTHERHYGRAPRGIWLPEAAYRPAGAWTPPVGGGHCRTRPGVEAFLDRAGFEYFIVDSGLLARGKSLGSYPDHFRDMENFRHDAAAAAPGRTAADASDTRLPYRVGNSGVSCFVRDPATGLQVWSRDTGYPGDPVYLEFHKKSDTGGHRYWSVTGPDADLGDKALYDFDDAARCATDHARHFAGLVTGLLADASPGGILVAPFDAELFGHWWFEGVDWLETVLEELHTSGAVAPGSLSEHLHTHPATTAVDLPEGSWGQGGHHFVWMNPQVEWSWEKLYAVEDEVWSVMEAARTAESRDALRFAKAALRQLLVMSASDWQFLITTGAAGDYAAERLELHAKDASRLAEVARRLAGGAEATAEEMELLRTLEAREPLFSELEAAVGGGVPVG
jgi:1,4-alpha-glucan branching enzyme